MDDQERQSRDKAHELLAKLRFVAIELGNSPALGGDVRVELGPRATVLVGRNGVGKSAILERIHEALRAAVAGTSEHQIDPGRLTCDISQGNDRTIRYRYQCIWQPPEETDSEGPDSEVDEELQNLPSMAGEDEICIEVPSGKPLWRVKDGRFIDGDGTEKDDVVNSLRMLFLRRVCIASGVPRNARQELVLPDSSLREMLATRGPLGRDRISSLIYRLARWHKVKSEHFEELVAVGRRTGLFNDIHVKRYRDPDAANLPPNKRKNLVSVEIDGVNIGLVSDGVLRAVELLVALVSPDIKLLLVEEPETAVHPGLLTRLLAEIDAYAGDRQIIMTTHSPQVASWARPDELRLVERRDGATHVRGLDAAEIARLERYLHDEGTLGEFVYSGALDG